MSEIISQWQPPLEEHRNGQILGYILRYRLFGYNNVPWSYQNITNEAQRNFLIQELITWKDYIVQIAAYNNMGVGVYTEGSKIKTKEGVPEAPPTNVKVEAINSTAARCRWTPPNPQQINGINQGYKIQAWQRRLIDGEWKDIERRMMTVPPSLIDPLAEQTAILGGLEKYTEYNISVLCFTDPGDGVASIQVPVMTLDDVPDEVTALHFDDVSDRSVKVLWAPPRFTNGILTGYTVRYQVKDRPDTLKSFNLTADDTELTVNQLQATTHYWFEIFAWTRVGSGTPKTATIQSGVEPVLPHAPTSLALSNIEAFSVVLQFTPGFDGNSSITKWKVEGQTARNMTWFTICEINDPDAETLTVTGLVPFTQYRLRLSASNVVGSSKPSEATKDFQTIQARPKHPPFNVTVRAMSAQQLRVRWIPLQQTEWYGNPRGYNISYKQLVKAPGTIKYLPRSVVIEDHTANSHVLDGLEEWTLYEVKMNACNDVGCSKESETAVERTREAVPSYGPLDVQANATTSTTTYQSPNLAPSGPPVGFVGSARSMSEIISQWQPPLEEHRNGQILGYILRYRLFGYNNVPWSYQNITNEAQRNFLIQELITWKDYIVQIAAYNNMGVGVYTEGSKIKTKEGVPEAPPTNVKVEAINSTAARCRWTPPNPQQINGINQGYKIQAWQRRLIDGEWKDIERRMMTVPPSLIDPLAEQTAILGGLEKYTEYNISVLCFTDPGDGVASIQVPVMTLDDVPDEVTALHFDDVSDRSVKVLWAPPRFTNGILTGYTVRYQVKDRPDTLKSFNLTADDTELTVNQLQATTHYWFEIFAWTRVGSGTPKTATIQSGVEPVLPHAPTSLALSNIEAFSVVLQFTPGFDGNSSITKWKVEGQTARNMTWFTICEINDPDAETLTVTGLVPFTQYRLRLSASNVVGSSKPSEATKDFQTIQARPKHPPFNVTVRAMSAQQLRVRWIPLQQTEWYGNPRGYNISYKQLVKAPGTIKYLPRSVVIEDHTANSHVLDGLEEWTLYEVKMNACNDVGCSKESETAVERTREAVPSYGPLDVQANATTSTTVVVQWGEVPPQHRNGQIDGYKVFYAATDRGQQVLHKTIPNNATFTTTLTELKKFVVYHVQVLAYTRLGNGALSTPPIRVQTFEDTPGVPSNVSFPDVTLTMARIIWDVPMDPNGEILAYQVTYTLNGSAMLNYSREFPPSDRTFRATGLLPEKYYSFSCTAQTRLGWGKIATALVYTTNNRERPQAPSVPQISRSQIQAHQITFSWTPGRDGFAPLRYYTVEMRENEGRWQPLPERVDPLLSSYTALGLRPYMTYQFRIQATNDLGPSAFSRESVVVRTLPAAPAVGVGGLKVVK